MALQDMEKIQSMLCLILWVKKNLRKGIAPHIFFKNSDDTANDLTPKNLQFFPGLFQ